MKRVLWLASLTVILVLSVWIYIKQHSAEKDLEGLTAINKQNEAILAHIGSLEDTQKEKELYMAFMVYMNPKIPLLDVELIYKAINDNWKLSGLTKFDFFTLAALESSYNRYNKTGGFGLFSVTQGTWEDYKRQGKLKGEIKQIYDPQYNAYCAAIIAADYRKEIVHLFKGHDDATINKLALLAYNKGPSKYLESSDDAYVKAHERRKLEFKQLMESKNGKSM